MGELTDELIAFLDQHISLLAAGRDRELRPSITRAVGLVPGADRKSFTAFLADRPGAALLSILEVGAPFAVTATHVPTHRAMQMKGVVTAPSGDRRLREAAALGQKLAIVPKPRNKQLDMPGLTVRPTASVSELMRMFG